MNPQKNDEVAQWMESLGWIWRGDEPDEQIFVKHGFVPLGIEEAQHFYDAQQAAVAEALEKAGDMMLDRSIALTNEETAVKWDDVVVVLAALRGKQ